MVVYGLPLRNYLGFHNLISNTVAWVAAVLFAYVVNNGVFVFRSRPGSAYQVLRGFPAVCRRAVFFIRGGPAFMWVLVDILR